MRPKGAWVVGGAEGDTVSFARGATEKGEEIRRLEKKENVKVGI